MNGKAGIPQRAGSVSSQTFTRYESHPDSRPSTIGELAKSAVMAGWIAKATRSFSAMSRSEPKSKEAWVEPVIAIMSSASRPRAARNGRITSYRFFGIHGTVAAVPHGR